MLKNHIRDVFDRGAATYGQQVRFFDYFAKQLVAQIPLSKEAHVLDIATGRGAVLKHVASRIGSYGKMVGIDISQNMVTETTKELAELIPNAQFLCMDAEQVVFADNSFDAIFCGFGIFFFPNLAKALAEYMRVLKPGGYVAFSTWNTYHPCQTIFTEEYNKLHQDTHPLPHLTYEELIKQLTTAGFNNIKTIHDQIDYVYPSIDAWLTSLWSHFTRSRLEQLSPIQLTRLNQALHTRMASLLQPDGLHDIKTAIYTIATKAE